MSLDWVKWRTGRKVGRTIYWQRGPAPSDDDPLIGMMDTAELAADAVDSHNAMGRVERDRRDGLRPNPMKAWGADYTDQTRHAMRGRRHVGLDITALRQATYIEPQDYADENYERFHRAWINPDFEERSDGLRTGFYVAAKAVRFRAGSYSGYNCWREWLCGFALGVEPQEVWNDPESYAGRPLVELIHFADNEGIIGPRTSAKLARDFAEHEDRAREAAAATDAPEWHLGRYQDWRRAFEAAKDGGLVHFH